MHFTCGNDSGAGTIFSIGRLGDYFTTFPSLVLFTEVVDEETEILAGIPVPWIMQQQCVQPSTSTACLIIRLPKVKFTGLTLNCYTQKCNASITFDLEKLGSPPSTPKTATGIPKRLYESHYKTQHKYL